MKNINEYINVLRTDYSRNELDEKLISSDPFIQFQCWLEEAIALKVPEPSAMLLSTASLDGRPSSRVMLLKGFDEQGFCFYTNYESHKGQQMLSNPWVSLNFFWPALEKQIRIEGTVTKIAERESEEYFNSRPRESKIGAWSSKQSAEIKNREELSKKVEEMTALFKDKEVPRPPYWGGFCVLPIQFEFWQGGLSRLHDRIVYTLQEDGKWETKRISP